MKITVEFSDAEMKDICRFADERKKGPAIRKLTLNTLMLKRRREIADKFLSGELSAEVPGYEAGRAADRRKDAEREKRRSA